jgi:hypothetical protein
MLRIYSDQLTQKFSGDKLNVTFTDSLAGSRAYNHHDKSTLYSCSWPWLEKLLADEWAESEVHNNVRNGIHFTKRRYKCLNTGGKTRKDLPI